MARRAAAASFFFFGRGERGGTGEPEAGQMPWEEEREKENEEREPSGAPPTGAFFQEGKEKKKKVEGCTVWGRGRKSNENLFP